jgi:cytidine deaminase
MIKDIVSAANKVKDHAYSPYSHFKVGASILSNNNNIYSGCNVESCAYGATLCAEGAAIANMVSNGEYKIAEIAITSSSNSVCYPCGICLQKILEFSDDKTKIHLCVNGQIKESYVVLDLLPKGFVPAIFQ